MDSPTAVIRSDGSYDERLRDLYHANGSGTCQPLKGGLHAKPRGLVRVEKLLRNASEESGLIFLPAWELTSSHPELHVGRHRSNATQVGPLAWSATMPPPRIGWRAFSVEVEFPGAGAFRYKLNTQARIVPDTFPFPPCEGAGCKGALL